MKGVPVSLSATTTNLVRFAFPSRTSFRDHLAVILARVGER
ncbi:MAG: hypothetical protein ACUVRY_08680 [Thermoanaerobaculaceae bacterium]